MTKIIGYVFWSIFKNMDVLECYKNFIQNYPLFFSNCLARFFFSFSTFFFMLPLLPILSHVLIFSHIFFHVAFSFRKILFFCTNKKKNPSFIFFEGEKLGFSCVDKCGTRFHPIFFLLEKLGFLFQFR